VDEDVVPGVADEEVSTSPGTVTHCLPKGLINLSNKQLPRPRGPVLNLQLKLRPQLCLTLASKFQAGLKRLLKAMLPQLLPHLLDGRALRASRVRMEEPL
jgi:hypothetical protein